MADIREKIYDNLRFNRITCGHPWRPAHRIPFIMKLNKYDADSFQETINALLREGIFEFDDDDTDNYFLTQFGEDTIYENMDNCLESLVDYLINNEYVENSLLTIQHVLSIKTGLNAIEEKHLQGVLESLIKEGVFELDEFGYRLTCFGEEYLKKIYQKR